MEKSSIMDKSDKPDPHDLLAFLPWACGQLQLSKNVCIAKVLQNEYVSTAASERGKGKGMKSRPRLPSVSSTHVGKKEDASENESSGARDESIRINAIYDHADSLVGLKFDKNSSLPRQLLQIIALVVKFQIYLTSLIINQGLNKSVLHEIVGFLPNSKITDICLDNCFLAEGSYYTLVENATNLRNLSLSRCRINDVVVELLFNQLYHPKPCSTTILVLNLSSNRITDDGAKSISEALKMNDKLTYLNLADNMITDKGAVSIFDVLLEFPLTEIELMEMRSRHMKYMRDKHALVLQMAREMPMMELFKSKKQTARSAKPKKKGEKDIESALPSEKSIIPADTFYDKALTLVENSLHPYTDPYSLENVTLREGMTYCLGNNSLAYLNLSYNSLSFPSVEKLLEVLVYQRDLDRKPRGLLNCRIEGNPLPIGCKELVQIEELLETGLTGSKRGQPPVKKKGRN